MAKRNVTRVKVNLRDLAAGEHSPDPNTLLCVGRGAGASAGRGFRPNVRGIGKTATSIKSGIRNRKKIR